MIKAGSVIRSKNVIFAYSEDGTSVFFDNDDFLLVINVHPFNDIDVIGGWKTGKAVQFRNGSIVTAKEVKNVSPIRFNFKAMNFNDNYEIVDMNI